MSLVPACVECSAPIDPYGRDGSMPLCAKCKVAAGIALNPGEAVIDHKPVWAVMPEPKPDRLARDLERDLAFTMELEAKRRRAA